MATLHTLEERGKLVAYEADVGPRRGVERYLYLCPNLPNWLETTLRPAPVDRGRDLTPYEQVKILFDEFAQGGNMHIGTDFTRVMPTGSGIVAMRTTDVRLFGWFYRPRYLVIACAELKKVIRERRLTNVLRDQAKRFRTELPLTSPKYVAGELRILIDGGPDE